MTDEVLQPGQPPKPETDASVPADPAKPSPKRMRLTAKQNLVLAARQQGMTIEQIARACDIDERSIYRWRAENLSFSGPWDRGTMDSGRITPAVEMTKRKQIVMPPPTADERDPTKLAFYRYAKMELYVKQRDSEITQQAFKAGCDGLKAMAPTYGVDLSVVEGSDAFDTLKHFADLMGAHDELLTALERHIPDIPIATEEQKKKWMQTIQRTRNVRNICRASAPHFILYTFRIQREKIERMAHPLLPPDSKEYGLLVVGPQQLRIITTMTQRRKSLTEIHPDAGKSQLQMGVVTWELANNPDRCHVYVSHSEEQAQKRLKYIQDAFDDRTETGKRCRALFPNAKLDRSCRSTMNQFTLVRKISAVEPSLCAVSFVGNVEGDKFTQMDFDDPIPMSDSYEPTRRLRNCQRMKASWEKRISVAGGWRMNGSPTAENDLYAMIEKMPDVHIRKMPVGDNFEPVIGISRDEESLRLEYRKDPLLYAQQFQLKPISDSDRIVLDVKYYDPQSAEGMIVEAGGKNEDRQVWISVDPGGTGKTRAGNWCGTGRAVLYQGKLYITWATKTRQTPDEMYKRLGEIAADPWEAMDLFSFELVGQAAAYQLGPLEKDPAIGGAGKLVKFSPTIHNKVERLVNIAPALVRGLILFRGEYEGPVTARRLVGAAKETHECVSQILRTTKVSKNEDDDLLDVVTQVAYQVRHQVGIPNAAEEDDGLTIEQRRIKERVDARFGVGKNRENDSYLSPPEGMRVGQGPRNIIPMQYWRHTG